MTRLRHRADVNPRTPEFDRLADKADVTFIPLEHVWPEDLLDISMTRAKSEVASGYTRFRQGDVIIPKITPTFQAARSAIVPSLPCEAGVGTTELHVVRPRSIDQRYLYYLVNTSSFLQGGEAQMTGVAGQKRVPDSWLRDLRIPTDDLVTQRQITKYLDCEASHIDALVSAKTRLGRLLSERIPALLEAMIAELSHRADVTLVPLRYVLREKDKRVGSGEAPELLSVSIHHGVVPRVGISDRATRADNLSRYKLVRTDNLVINRMRAFQGGVGVAKTDGCVSPDYTVLELASDLDPGFADHLFRSDWFAGQMTMRLRGIGEPGQGNVRTPRVRFSDLGDVFLRLPSLKRQQALSADLDHSVGKTRAILDSLTDQLRFFAEYRQALITAAVTGQLDEATLKGKRPLSESMGMEAPA